MCIQGVSHMLRLFTDQRRVSTVSIPAGEDDSRMNALRLTHPLSMSLADDAPSTPKKRLDRNGCVELSQHLMRPDGLPAECKQFQDIVTSLKRRDSDTTHGSQVLS